MRVRKCIPKAHITVLMILNAYGPGRAATCTLYNPNAAHKETSALLRSTQNIVPRKHHVTVQGCTAIIETNYVRYDAKTFPDH